MYLGWFTSGGFAPGAFGASPKVFGDQRWAGCGFFLVYGWVWNGRSGLKLMRLLVVLAMAFSATAARACHPVPEFAYDDVGSEAVSVLIATVVDAAFASRNRLSCWDVEYAGATYLSGAGPEAFSVTNCTEVAYEDAEWDEATVRAFGLVRSAEVLVGIVRDAQGAGYRYAVPNCWGPLHYNLDLASEEERARLLAELAQVIGGKR